MNLDSSSYFAIFWSLHLLAASNLKTFIYLHPQKSKPPYSFNFYATDFNYTIGRDNIILLSLEYNIRSFIDVHC